MAYITISCIQYIHGDDHNIVINAVLFLAFLCCVFCFFCVFVLCSMGSMLLILFFCVVLFCFACLRPVSCVPTVALACVSGFYILDFPRRFSLTFIDVMNTNLIIYLMAPQRFPVVTVIRYDKSHMI